MILPLTVVILPGTIVASLEEEEEEEALARAGEPSGSGVGGGEGGEEASIALPPPRGEGGIAESVAPVPTAGGGSAQAAASEGSATWVESLQARPLSSTEVGAPGKAAEEGGEEAGMAPPVASPLESSRIIPNDAEPPLGGIACQYPGACPTSSREDPLFDAGTTRAFSRFHDCSTEAYGGEEEAGDAGEAPDTSLTSQGVGTAAASWFVRVTSRETAGLPEARVFQVGVTVTRAEQVGEAAEEEVEVEEANDTGDDDDGGAPAAPPPPPLRFHDDANLLAARVRPPPAEGFRSPKTSSGMSSVRGPSGPEGAERSGEAGEEFEVFDAAADALEVADAMAKPATASSSARAVAAAFPAGNDELTFFGTRLRAAERDMVRRSRRREEEEKLKQRERNPNRLTGSFFFTRVCSLPGQKDAKKPPRGGETDL
jgi:hypothetical protein